MKSLLLVDDHKIVRSGLKTLLSNLNFDRIDEADSGKMAYALAQEHSYSLIIMDISMEGMSGLDALSKIITRIPKQKILILSMHDSDLVIEKSKKLGAMGFVTKSDISDNLFQAVEQVLAGQYFFPEIKISDNRLNELNEREFEIFKMIASGKTIKNIAADMNISQKTAANYQTSIKQKLAIDNPIEFYKLAVELNLIKS
ncbi:response regulator transcription factor [Methylophilaceae bacterium]|nr:response regulator transcription factor [Methylophilaceae bacterium]